MPRFHYSKWSCGGNTTLFFQKGCVSAHAASTLVQSALTQEALACEQAGFIDLQGLTLTMAGGEFCANAARAFGACLAHEASRSHACKQPPPTQGKVFQANIAVSGWPEKILVQAQGSAPLWTVTSHLPLPSTKLVWPFDDECVSVRLPGITHLLLPEERYPLPDPSCAKAIHASLRKRYAADLDPCVGAIYWKKEEDGFALTPLVYVRDLNTLFFEQACGSGTLALALALPKVFQKQVAIRQPSGATLLVKVDPEGKSACLSGSVHLISEGTFWLEESINRSQRS